jgi:hypothetical protein
MALFQLHWLEPILLYCTKLANFSLMSGMFPTKAISSTEIMSCPRPSQKCVEEVAIGISFQDIQVGAHPRLEYQNGRKSISSYSGERSFITRKPKGSRR